MIDTKNIMGLKPRELRTLQNAVDILKKAYGLDEKDIDRFIYLLQNAGDMKEKIDGMEQRIGKVEKTLKGDTDKSQATAYVQAMNRKLEDFNL